jgi:hypothetical protein
MTQAAMMSFGGARNLYQWTEEPPTGASPTERRVLAAEDHFFERWNQAALICDDLRKAQNALDSSRPGAAEATKRLDAALSRFSAIPTSFLGRSTTALSALQGSVAQVDGAIALAEVTLAAVSRRYGIKIR